MRGQPGFWYIDERYSRLSKAGNPLEKLDALVPWEVFRGTLARALKRSDGAKGARPPLIPAQQRPHSPHLLGFPMQRTFVRPSRG